MPGRLKILASEDDEGVRSFLSSLLTEHGHEVEFASDSDDVFRRLGRTRFDLLILDVQAPGLDGYAVAGKISANISNRPKMLIFTGGDVDSERHRFYACGADALVRKGVPCAELLSAVDALFRPPARTAAADAAPAQAPAPAPAPRRLSTAGTRQDELAGLAAKLSRLEEQLAARNQRYEEFIRDLLREKQRTEKNYLEFRRVDAEVARLKRWVYAAGAAAAAALVAAFL